MAYFTKYLGITVLVSLIVLSAGACANFYSTENETVPAELRGKWVGSAADALGVTLTFTASSFTYSKGSNSYTLGSLTFKKAVNTNNYTKTAYPAGYRFRGKQTAGSGTYASLIASEDDEDPVFLDGGKTKLCWGNENSQNWVFLLIN